ncbi:MAG: hypothetical protein JHC25_03145 [Thermodesulfobacterium sp.]|jgi:hypothetical protein|nr:hypothetical protein [Thermodesulfobacterium sp.]
MSGGNITLVGLKGKVHIKIDRLSHEDLLLEIIGPGYELNQKLAIKNEELRKTVLELMQTYKLSPELIYTQDITISTYLLL